MDVRKIVVIVEEEEAARTALKWALHNFLRYGDLITLLHVFSPSSRSRKKLRLLRLKGYQLALSFKDLCNSFFNTNVEIIVTEGDEEGGRIAAMVREIGAFALVVGLHDHSFLFKLAMGHRDLPSNLNCRILAIKQPATDEVESAKKTSTRATLRRNLTSMDFSQIEIATLNVPDNPPAKVPYRICPDPSLIICRWRKFRRRRNS